MTIYSSHQVILITQRPIPEIFAKMLRIVGVENLSFFELAILIFSSKKNCFLLHPNENQATFIG